jgi:hypothetical protein
MKKGQFLGNQILINSKRAQLTLFIIIGVVLIAGIVAFFIIKNVDTTGLSKNLEPAYNAYLSCVQAKAGEGLTLMGQQAGYIYLEELPFEAGSPYAPSSSYLDFYGAPVPYWLYISGNNFLRVNKPSLSKMESDLARFVREGLTDCDLSSFYNQGVYLDIFNGTVDVAIEENRVKLNLNNPVFVYFENESALISNHEVLVNSKIGSFYKTASDIFEVEQNSSFLEAYALDTLRLNAPVTGVEIGCSPKIFNEAQIKENLSASLETNFAYLKVKGSYYTLNNVENKYFVTDLGDFVSENVNFVYSRSWPTKIEMYGDKFVEPIGNQPGMGMLGMCFVPYNFVYDLYFPVLVQLYSNNELFQFPVVVVVKNNQMREALLTDNETSLESPICKTRNHNVSVSVFDLDLNPISADLRFSCLSDSCEAGRVQERAGRATETIQLPQCVNGILTAYADGYAPSDVLVSTNAQTSADILLRKIHSVKVNLPTVTSATLVFSSNDYSSMINYPSSNTIDLVEGEYNLTAYVYKDSSIIFPEIKDRKCFEVASTSFAGLLGGTNEQCFDVSVPAQEVESALVGGGRGMDYFVESDLKSGKQLNIDIPLFKTPGNLQELQDNYLTWEDALISTTWK